MTDVRYAHLTDEQRGLLSRAEKVAKMLVPIAAGGEPGRLNRPLFAAALNFASTLRTLSPGARPFSR